MKDINIHFSKNCGFRWSSLNTRKYKIFVKGFGFKDGKYFKDEKIGNLFKPLAEKSSNKYLFENFIEIVKAMNGNFAIVIEGNNWLFASVDRVRSFPLFYGKKKHKFFISDDAYWVREQVGDNQIDKLASIEFLLTGYVTGSDTLFPNVKQLQAGESLFVKKIQDEDFKFNTIRYYRYIYDNLFKESQETLLRYFDQILIDVFQRLIQSTHGYDLVVPLSGGLDSRLVVMMLKRLGCKNIRCFSYGYLGNWESKISKQVANKLGYKWFFVPYSRKSWYYWFHSKELREYYRYANNLSSLAHLQDWSAVWELKKRKLISENSIFVPGHTGDFISGRHIPLNFFHLKEINKNTLVQAIWKKHYSLWKWSSFRNRLEPILYNRVLSRIGYDLPYRTPEEVASAYECWEWQERQSKFICNSVRVYEFFGYKWRIPLWDLKIMNFWKRVPLCYKKDQNLYRRFVNKIAHDLNIKVYAPSYITLIIDKCERIFDSRYGRFNGNLSFPSYLNLKLKDILKITDEMPEFVRKLSHRNIYFINLIGLISLYQLEYIRSYTKQYSS